MQLRCETVEIPCRDLSTLAWDGDDLMDVTSHRRIRLDGSFSRPSFLLGYPFDRGLCLRRSGTFWTLA